MRNGSNLLIALLVFGLAGPAPAATLERGNGPEPSTLDAHRCPEVACANVLRDLYEGLVAEDGVTTATLLQTAQRELAEIDAAIVRLGAGEYGVCAGCQLPIPLDRLRVRPTATLCVACASAPTVNGR